MPLPTTGGDSIAIPPEYFGLQMNSGIIGHQPWPIDAFGGTRLWDSNTHWEDINTSDGVYKWEILDNWLATAYYRNVDVLYTFGQVPTWASSKPHDHDCAGEPGSCDPPNDLDRDGGGSDQHWKDFVSAIVERSQHGKTAHIKYWEIWNEAYHPIAWKGTFQQMARMARDARDIIKQADPEARVLTPSVEFDLEGQNWLDGYLKAGGGEYADLIAFHGYVQRPGHTPLPEDFIPYYEALKKVVAKYGAEYTPMWDTEASWGKPSVSGFTDPDMQAAFVARFYLLQWSVGVPRFYWYQWNSENGDGTLWIPRGRFGTVLKPGMAYGQVYDWMVGAIMTSRCSAEGSVWTCKLTRDNVYQAMVVWDASKTCHHSACNTAPFAFDPIYTKYRDVYGNVHVLNGPRVPIGAKPILLETDGRRAEDVQGNR